MKQFFQASIGALALLAGGLIYLCSRSETLLMFAWCENIGLSGTIASLRGTTGQMFAVCPAWVRFSLPNALWLFGGIVILASIWGRLFRHDRLFWLASFWLFAIGAESAQGIGAMPGTFEWQDVFLMGGATALAIPLIRHANPDEK